MGLAMFLAQQPTDTANMVIGSACVFIGILGAFYLAYGKK